MSEWSVLVGDVRERLKELPDQSVQCCVTSPPYWGLRDYGTAKWEGGDPACDHSPERRGGRFAAPVSEKQRSNTGSGTMSSRDCPCGAVRVDNQIGLEGSPVAYVESLVSVFREVKRVLKDDGTLWLNLGDSYAHDTKWGGSSSNKNELQQGYARPQQRGESGLKSKDLVGIPWRVAFALQADGWYLRSDIIWAKPNPMPESVTDRPTKSHEYIFLLTKNERYFYDADAIAEPASSMLAQIEQGYDGLGTKDYEGSGVQNPSTVKSRIIANARRKVELRKGRNTDRRDGGSSDIAARGLGRNARSVWTITPQPYPEAHFATFPEALPERCIKAGSKLGDTVLDPFCGSGTTGQVAIQTRRSFVGIELNPTYAELARKRIGGAAPLFSQEVTQSLVAADDVDQTTSTQQGQLEW